MGRESDCAGCGGLGQNGLMLTTFLLAVAPALAQDPIGDRLDALIEAGRTRGISVAVAQPDGSLDSRASMPAI